MLDFHIGPPQSPYHIRRQDTLFFPKNGFVPYFETGCSSVGGILANKVGNSPMG